MRSPLAVLLGLAALVAVAGCAPQERAPDDAAQAKFDRERRPEIVVRALGLAPGKRVADVGAGNGLLTVHLARAVSPGGRVVATDVDAAALEQLRSRVRAAGCDRVVESRLVQAGVPGLEPDMFDAILLARVDHYLEDRTAWLLAAGPTLRSGGRLVIANRSFLRQPALAAAEAAGFRRVAETSEVPGEFVAVFERAGGRPLTSREVSP